MKVIRNNSGKLVLAIIVVLVLVFCLGVGAFTFSKLSKRAKAGDRKAPVELTVWKLEEFVVNLADPLEPRYLKVNIVLEVESKGKGHGEGEANPEEARARDAIITVLTKRRFADLVSEQGKTLLKSDLKSALNSVLQECKVVNIYFTSFAMQ